MRNTILSGLLLSLVSTATLGQASAPLLAGQANEARYTDIYPDLDLFADPATVPEQTTVTDTELLDLDQDGQPDVRFTASAVNSFATNFFYVHKDAYLTFLNPSSTLQFACSRGELLYYGLDEPITDALRIKPSNYAPSAWESSTTSTNILNTIYLASYFGGSGGTSVSGDFAGSRQGYIAFRLRAGNTWRYGWLQVQTWTILGPNVHLAVQAYALQNFVLGTTASSAAAAQWQLYPTSAAEFVTVKAGTEAGRVTVLDALGRVASPTYPVAAGQPLRVATAELPAGLYLLRVETSQATFTKRFYKQ
jgi:hypothetical protein